MAQFIVNHWQEIINRSSKADCYSGFLSVDFLVYIY